MLFPMVERHRASSSSIRERRPRRPRRHTDDDVELLVRSFYRYAAMDELLGPIFAAAHVDWDAHIATLTDFWSWQLLGEPGYTGNPLRAHEPVHARTPFTDAHFERWLELFTSTVDEHFRGPTRTWPRPERRKMATALRRLLADRSGRGGELRAGCRPDRPSGAPDYSSPMTATRSCVGSRG